MNDDDIKYYVLINRPHGINTVGPFLTDADRSNYICAIWFGKPARRPYSQRGERVPFNRDKDRLHLTAVCKNRLYEIRDVTVGDILKASNFQRLSKKTKSIVNNE